MLALFTAIVPLNTGCKKKDTINYIRADDQEIVILRDGKELAIVQPDPNGTRATILSRAGDSITIYTRRSGITSEIEMKHTNKTGVEFLTIGNDTEHLVSDEQFVEIKEAMLRITKHKQEEAEPAGADQPAPAPAKKAK